MRFRLASVAAVVVVPVLLAGCSGQQPDPPPASHSAPPPAASQQPPAGGKVEGVAWVNQLCGLVGGFTKAQNQGPGVDKSSPQAFKATSLAHLRSAAREADSTLHGLREMKPSPIKGADGITDSFEKGFVQVSNVLHSAVAKAEGVDTSDKRAFLQGMKAVQAELKKGQQLDFRDGFAKFTHNKQLNAAAAQAPKCQALTSSQQQKQPGQPKPGQPKPQPQQPAQPR